MKFFLRILGLLLVLATGQAFAQAQQELAGTWQGKLAVDPQTSLTIQFVFTKKPDGTYSAVLNSPDNGAIKNVAASAVTWNAGALKLDVPSLSGSYAGTLKDGKFDGKWTQQGSALPLALSPYKKPVMAKAAMETLTGAWNGPLQIPNGGPKLTFVFRFKPNAKGEMEGTFSLPEQGAVDIPMSDIEFADNKLFLRVAAGPGAEFNGTYSAGSLSGFWRAGPQPPPGFAVSLKKGEAPVATLKLSTEAFASLAGKWAGKLDAPTPDGKTVTQNVVLRIETNTVGQYVGFLDVENPVQKQKASLPVSEASVAAGKVVLKIGPGEYKGDLAGKTLKGDLTLGPRALPLVLTKQ